MKKQSRFLLTPILVLLFLTGTFGTACRPAETQAAYRALRMTPFHQMPEEVKAAPFPVQEAYQFAFANPDLLREIPCYCGCGGGSLDHANNYDCYVAEVDSAGTVEYDTHALACSICVDITQDTMRLLREGQEMPEIKAYVDETYAKFGPSTMSES